MKCEEGLVQVCLEGRVATPAEMAAPKIDLQPLDGTLNRCTLANRLLEALRHRRIERIDRREIVEGDADVTPQRRVATAALLLEWTRGTRDYAFFVHRRTVEVTLC